ncbi:hypothetical protein GQF61_17790 [Sphingobacterium sp. DK4209]|uniref:Lipoprotein n=1 Tax=Sphingobacterium zhuxiongii TaxID=2662364 RepID=A0A5Q0QG35_9SPHI|nr:MULTISPECIES: hypothetical protein [unclassified Sphingobacterium]MVZ67694.1 hypothetical protein [Sphingobacterium sp. DK4209]QGA26828.1 hypothetical protein GFH32_11075 [Sphingobacterium sp. dk4302]
MKKATTIVLCSLLWLFASCSKDKNDEYWQKKADDKYQEIENLVYSVSCENIDDFEIMSYNSTYFPVHKNIKSRFENLIEEHRYYRTKWFDIEPQINFSLNVWVINPPVELICHQGRPKLRYAQDLTLEETNKFILSNYKKLKEFYNDVPCTDPKDWQAIIVSKDCRCEFVTAHKTIRVSEFYELLNVQKVLDWQWRVLSEVKCDEPCTIKLGPIICKDGKPYVQ